MRNEDLARPLSYAEIYSTDCPLEFGEFVVQSCSYGDLADCVEIRAARQHPYLSATARNPGLFPTQPRAAVASRNRCRLTPSHRLLLACSKFFLCRNS